jgi:hypothetical protein
MVVGPAARRVRAETLFRDRRPVPDRDRDGTRREGATSPGREGEEGARGREEAEAGGGSDASDAAEDDAPAEAEAEEEEDDGAADGDDFEEID